MLSCCSCREDRTEIVAWRTANGLRYKCSVIYVRMGSPRELWIQCLVGEAFNPVTICILCGKRVQFSWAIFALMLSFILVHRSIYSYAFYLVDPDLLLSIRQKWKKKTQTQFDHFCTHQMIFFSCIRFVSALSPLHKNSHCRSSSAIEEHYGPETHGNNIIILLYFPASHFKSFVPFLLPLLVVVGAHNM